MDTQIHLIRFFHDLKFVKITAEKTELKNARSKHYTIALPVLRIRIRIHMFLGLPDPDPLVIYHHAKIVRKTLIPTIL